MSIKICPRCSEPREESLFCKGSAFCKICRTNYYQENKERILSRQKEYASLNKEKLSKRNRLYYENNKERIKNYQLKNRDKIRETERVYWSNNKEKKAEKDRKYYLKHKEEMNSKAREYRIKNREELLIYGRELIRNLRNKVLDKLGGKCVICYLNDRRCLHIDHVNGGGKKELQTITVYSWYKLILEETPPSPIQLLCANCHYLKGYKPPTNPDNYRLKKRKKAIAKLGSKCVHCNLDNEILLCIDHVHGGGRQEIKKFNNDLNGRVLKDTEGKYQLLCHNCNWIKKTVNEETRKTG